MSTNINDPIAQTRWRHIWSLSWPIFLANITVPLVGAVDAAMMGRLDNVAYIGGVGLGALIFNFIYFGFGFLRMGTTGLVAQAHGRNLPDEIVNLLARGLFLALSFGILLILAMPVINWIAVISFAGSSDVEALMVSYLNVRLFAVPAALANTVLIGCLFGRQNMRLCMAHLLIVNVLNLILNIGFVLGLGMDVEGVALASAIAQWTGFIVTFSLMKWQWGHMLDGFIKHLFSGLFTGNSRWLQWDAFGDFFRLGRDIFIRTMLLLVCEAILLNQAAQLGDLELAACHLMMVIFTMIAFGLDGFAHAAEALVGAAIGRNDRDMLDRAIWRTNSLAFLTAILIALIIWLGRDIIIGLLTQQSDLFALTAAHWIWIIMIAPASCLAFQLDGIFIGATRASEMRNAMIISAILFVLLIWGLRGYGIAGLMSAFTIYLALRGFTLWLYLGRVRKMAEHN
ncbi:MATE family efflux transporter [Candidatus Puniceispirillum sp.]|uniref:MATE family efflux transporter n=1 Tax=Candidatus Puniceispirillum sp. TaxID=2026719 RepID=UPI003F6A4860